MAGLIKAGMKYGTIVEKMQEMLQRANKNGGKVEEITRPNAKQNIYHERDKSGNHVASVWVDKEGDSRGRLAMYSYNGLLYSGYLDKNGQAKITEIKGNGLKAEDKNGDGVVQQNEISFEA